MKKFFTRATALLSLFAVVACSEDALVENTSVGDGTIKEISITGKDFQFDGVTRSSVSITESGASFTWDEDDVIGIFPNEGDQVSFAMDNGAGTQTATFSGGGWALKSSATYAAYYPHVYENRDMTKIPVSYVGQTQNGNANTAHIGAYDFMAASVSTPSNGKVAFDMLHLGCLVQLKITVPNAGTLSSVTLTADEEVFVEKGYIDLTATAPSIISTQTASSLIVDLKDVATTTTSEVVTVYFMMAPVDMTGKIFTVKVGSLEGTVAAKNFEGGRAYQLTTPLRISEPIAVDLGLSVKWAIYNIGAESPEEYGDYIAWGETTPKSIYNATYSFTHGKTLEELMSSKIVDSNGNLTAAYDAATVNWGKSWRLPTQTEMVELINNCTWTRAIQNNINGYLVSSKTNSNSIFLPAGGVRFERYLQDCGLIGHYWTATASALEDRYWTYNSYFSLYDGYTDGFRMLCGFRGSGYLIRPVTE